MCILIIFYTLRVFLIQMQQYGNVREHVLFDDFTISTECLE